MSKRAYGELRDEIEHLGGTMIYQRAGYRYGAWIITLNGELIIIEAPGDRTFKALDKLHVKKIPNPITWDDYGELRDDWKERLLATLK